MIPKYGIHLKYPTTKTMNGLNQFFTTIINALALAHSLFFLIFVGIGVVAAWWFRSFLFTGITLGVFGFLAYATQKISPEATPIIIDYLWAVVLGFGCAGLVRWAWLQRQF